MSERPVKYGAANLVISNLEQYKFTSSERIKEPERYGRYHGAEKANKLDSIQMAPGIHSYYLLHITFKYPMSGSETDARMMERYYLRGEVVRNLFQAKQGTTDGSSKCYGNTCRACCTEDLTTFGWRKCIRLAVKLTSKKINLHYFHTWYDND